jgi:hypothetical protein
LFQQAQIRQHRHHHHLLLDYQEFQQNLGRVFLNQQPVRRRLYQHRRHPIHLCHRHLHRQLRQRRHLLLW